MNAPVRLLSLLETATMLGVDESTVRRQIRAGALVACPIGRRILVHPIDLADYQQRLRQGWDVASVMFWAGSYTNAHDNRESAAHWRIATLDGVDYAWKPGMWLKGPISPLQPND